jgi:hypothetical protein
VTTLSFETLGDVDGGAVRIAMNHALQKAFLDMSDRPGLDKPRKITLTVDLKPQKSERGELIGAAVACTIDAKHPAKSTTVHMTANTEGLKFPVPDPSVTGTLSFDVRESAEAEE